MLRMNEVSVPLNYTDMLLRKVIAARLGISAAEVTAFKVWKRAIDARKKEDIRYVLTVDIKLSAQARIKDKKTTEVQVYTYAVPTSKKLEKRPIVVGFGPGGMFAALILAQSGQCPIVFERGGSVEERTKSVNAFWEKRELTEDSNVQFGEGGAGTFSDGKLTTGIKDERIRKVLTTMVECGAPKEILCDAKPHIGTDKLPETVKNIRERIKALGGEIHFNSCITDISIKDGKLQGVVVGGNLYETDHVIFAIGHSARDTFRMLETKGLPMEQKAFAIGARIEHRAEHIGRAQFGMNYKKLPAADYKLSAHLIGGRGVYTFCMCPGGDVVGAASQKGTVATNGMSSYARDGVNSNSGVLVGITPADMGDKGPLAGIELQEKIEKAAFAMAGSNYNAPVQRVEDFLKGRESRSFGDVSPTYRPGTSFVDINRLLPEYVSKAIAQGIGEFAKRLQGFNSPDALLTAPETRSSSPVRLLRKENMESLGIIGLYPCGEGAGYAGGIISAAVDGIRCAEAILLKTE